MLKLKHYSIQIIRDMLISIGIIILGSSSFYQCDCSAKVSSYVPVIANNLENYHPFQPIGPNETDLKKILKMAILNDRTETVRFIINKSGKDILKDLDVFDGTEMSFIDYAVSLGHIDLLKYMKNELYMNPSFLGLEIAERKEFSDVLHLFADIHEKLEEHRRIEEIKHMNLLLSVNGKTRKRINGPPAPAKKHEDKKSSD